MISGSRRPTLGLLASSPNAQTGKLMQLSEKHNYVPTFEKYADGIKFQMKTVIWKKTNKQKKVKVNSQLIMAFNH